MYIHVHIYILSLYGKYSAMIFFMLIKYLSVCLSGTLGTWSCLGGESPKHAQIHYRASKTIYCCGQFIAKATWAKPSAR